MNRRWIFVALVLSMAANLFLGGFLAARLLSEPAQAVLRPGNVRAWAGVAPERRREIRRWLADQGRRARAELQPARDHRRAAAALFNADHYDPAAVGAELESAQALELQVRQRVQRNMLQYALRLTPDERRAVTFMLGRNILRPGRRAGPPGALPERLGAAP